MKFPLDDIYSKVNKQLNITVYRQNIAEYYITDYVKTHSFNEISSKFIKAIKINLAAKFMLAVTDLKFISVLFYVIMLQN